MPPPLSDTGGGQFSKQDEDPEDSISLDSADLNSHVEDLWKEANPKRNKWQHNKAGEENPIKGINRSPDPLSDHSTQPPTYLGGVPDRLLKNRCPSKSSGSFTVIIRPAAILENI